MFPFDDNPHTACIVCRHVLNKEEAIAYITHDEDGMWRFLFDKEHSMDDGCKDCISRRSLCIRPFYW